MTVSVTEARADLPSLLDAVERGHEVTITRHGKPVAVLMSRAARMSAGRARAFEGAAELRRRRVAAKGRPLFQGPAWEPGYSDRLVAEIRADRDAEG